MSFCVQFGEDRAGILDAGVDCLQAEINIGCLSERNAEHWPLYAESGASLVWKRVGQNWSVGQAGDLMWLCAFGDAADASLEAVTSALYCELFAVLGEEWQLQRIWHYLPRINEPGTNGLERYRAFCSGRSRAFEITFGADFQGRLPAASAVGCEGDQFAIYACARRNAQVRYFENPLQTPAYRYSEAYGPRAPGFARASLTRVASHAGTGNVTTGSATSAAASQCEIYLSGTASIRNEHSLTEGGVLGQLDITVENLNRIAAECGLEHFLVHGINCTPLQKVADAALAGKGGADSVAVLRRCFKVYLRNADDYALIRSRFNALLCEADEVLYLRSDICRAELDIEIEASVLVRCI